MQKIAQTMDADGRVIRKGDIVAPIRDNVRSRVCEIAVEFDETFLQLRPVHQPYGKAVWHSAEHVMLMVSAKIVKEA